MQKHDPQQLHFIKMKSTRPQIDLMRLINAYTKMFTKVSLARWKLQINIKDTFRTSHDVYQEGVLF